MTIASSHPDGRSPATPNRPLRWAAILFLLYGAIEITDCAALIGIQAGAIPNLYPQFIFAEVERVMNEQPLLFLPAFLFFMTLHLWAGVGLWRNRLWGWWMGLFVTLAVMIFSPLLLPVSGYDMLVTIPLIGLLFIGRFGRQPITGGAS